MVLPQKSLIHHSHRQGSVLLAVMEAVLIGMMGYVAISHLFRNNVDSAESSLQSIEFTTLLGQINSVLRIGPSCAVAMGASSGSLQMYPSTNAIRGFKLYKSDGTTVWLSTSPPNQKFGGLTITRMDLEDIPMPSWWTGGRYASNMQLAKIIIEATNVLGQTLHNESLRLRVGIVTGNKIGDCTSLMFLGTDDSGLAVPLPIPVCAQGYRAIAPFGKTLKCAFLPYSGQCTGATPTHCWDQTTAGTTPDKPSVTYGDGTCCP